MIATAEDPAADRARRLGRAAAVVLVVTLPLTVVWRNAPPVTAALTTLLLLGAVVATGRGRPLFDALRAAATTPLGAATLAALAYMALSVTWSLRPERALGHLDDVLLTSAIVMVMLAAVPLTRSAPLDRLLPSALAVATLALALNVLFDGALNAALGRWQWVHYYNRGAQAIVLFLPLALALLWGLQRRLLAIGLALATAVAVLASASDSAALALLMMAMLAPLTWLWPIAMHRVAGIAMLVTLAATPFVVGLANDVVPAAVHERLGYLTVGIRGEIWSAFAELYWQRPILGFGLEGSSFVGRSAAAASLSEAQRTTLDVMHTHSTPLQIWFELGVVGAVLAIAVLGLAWQRIERRAGPLLPAATQAGVGAFAIAAISPGAWQAWWLCLLGLLVVAFAMVLANHRGG